MLVSKSIEEMDREFAKSAGMTLLEFECLPIFRQMEIKKELTNKKLKTNKNK